MITYKHYVSGKNSIYNVNHDYFGASGIINLVQVETTIDLTDVFDVTE